MIFSTKPSRRETIWGGIYLFIYVTILPWLVPLLARSIHAGLDAAQVNFIYFGVNFAAATVIFRKYLIQSLKDALRVPFPTLWYALLGYLGSQLLGSILTSIILRYFPDFANVNDGNVAALVEQNRQLMAIGAVLLAPITEELLFRGLIFRGLYDRSPLAAHLVSMTLFAAIHISGYFGVYDVKVLMLCFVQYLPAAYCLNFAYQHGGSIIAPIAMHMLTNLVALSLTR